MKLEFLPTLNRASFPDNAAEMSAKHKPWIVSNNVPAHIAKLLGQCGKLFYKIFVFDGVNTLSVASADLPFINKVRQTFWTDDKPSLSCLSTK